MSVLEAGAAIPRFSLATETGGTFTEADLRERPTFLVFYPFAFSPVCTDQLSLYEEVAEEIRGRGADIVAISCDATPAQTAFREKLGVNIPQLSDFEPKGASCRAFGVLHPGGFAERALVLTGTDGTVRWSRQEASPGDLPGADRLFEALEAAGL